ncbi:MAG: hypothetical protein LC126_29000 [Bryobacterales bacterium]|nr:hypothetical protein [Bryobacterales bacterium]
MKTTRRSWMAAVSAAGLAQTAASQAAEPNTDLEAITVKRHDEGVERLLKLQITDPTNPHHGGIPDDYGLVYAGSAAGITDSFCAAFHHPRSKFHKDPLMVRRLKLAIGFATRSQTPDGNIDLPITNFNSTPDTAFSVWGAGAAAHVARLHGSREIEGLIEPYLKTAARGLLHGGVHTPNHRWVVCSALAQLNELYPDPALVRRIDQWLAEGIDIDEDGQYDERSIIGYNVHIDRALIYIAHKLKRPELLEPVRRNLDSAFFLMHPTDEMVTEISHRQDRDQRGDIGVYWFAMHYMAAHDRNGRYAWAANKYAPTHAGLSNLMEYPELLKPLPEPIPPEENYVKEFRQLELTRIRRGNKSATILLHGDSRFFMLRSGDAVINAVRFASAFFGKGQFIPQQWAKAGDSYVLKQSLEGPYFQPLDPPHKVHAGEWTAMRPERQRRPICFLEQTAVITETEKGFRVRMQSSGTNGVPVAVEVSARGVEGLRMDGLLRAPGVTDGFLLPAGEATLRTDQHEIRFGPGRQENRYTQVRGAEAKLHGGSVYLTGFTPFDHTLEFICG